MTLHAFFKDVGKLPQQCFYTPEEVKRHGLPFDEWKVYDGTIYNVSPILSQIVTERSSVFARPKCCIAPSSKSLEIPLSEEAAHLTSGISFKLLLEKIPHLTNGAPKRSVETQMGLRMGELTRSARILNAHNTLTHETYVICVPSEETLHEIQMRLLPENRNMQSYTWRYLGKYLDLSKTLKENGVLDLKEEFSNASFHHIDYIPTLYMHFEDESC